MRKCLTSGRRAGCAIFHVTLAKSLAFAGFLLNTGLEIVVVAQEVSGILISRKLVGPDGLNEQPQFGSRPHRFRRRQLGAQVLLDLVVRPAA
jgi:hypothetical protein